LKPETVNFRREETNNQQQQNQEHKNAIIDIGRRILKSYVERKGEGKFRKEVLGGFAANKIGENWLRKQFERLVDEAEEAGKKFDFVDSWNLCLNKQGRELSIYDVLYLFRLFFTICFYFPAAYHSSS